MKSVAIVSGGLDSTVLAYSVAKDGGELHLLSFDYGQRHHKELEYAAETAVRLGASWNKVDLSYLSWMINKSSLTGTQAVPEGHYEAISMAQTVVPNRNAIMLALAFGYATNIQADSVYIGVHAGDHFIYPDCRPDFIAAFNLMETIATVGYGHAKLEAPFVNISKADIVKTGISLGVPFDKTWSCYNGRELQCGVCGTCAERRQAFRLCHFPDPTVYEKTPEELALWDKENGLEE